MTFLCDSCGKEGLPGYDHKIQEVRHLLWWQHPTVIRFPHYRVVCPTCKVVTERSDFLPVRGPRVTRPLAHLVCELYKITTQKVVGLLLGLHRGTVKVIDQTMMERSSRSALSTGSMSWGSTRSRPARGKATGL